MIVIKDAGFIFVNSKTFSTTVFKYLAMFEALTLSTEKAQLKRRRGSVGVYISTRGKCRFDLQPTANDEPKVQENQ